MRGFVTAAAKLLMDQHGWIAVSVAAQNVREMQAEGDLLGEECWLSIMDAILEIGRTYNGEAIENDGPEESAT